MEEKVKKDASGMLTYKGHPLLRKDNVIYYGTVSDKYISMLQIESAEEQNGISVPTKVLVSILHTDENLPPRERIVKTSEKSNLYDAMDIASVWLERYNSAK